MRYSELTDHRSMALDARRNDAYHAALARIVTPDSVVLDLGAGTGVLGLMAARLGARRVYLVEPEDVIAVAGEIAAANGLADRVRCLQGSLDEVVLPEPVDVIVSVMTGNFLVTEDLLPVLFRARDRWLKPGGALVPHAAVMEAAPVSAPAVHARAVAGWSTPQGGVDLSAVRRYAGNAVIYRAEGMREAGLLADPIAIQTVDFRTAADDAVHAEVACEIAGAGTCHGWLGWFRIALGDAWLSTSPWEAPLHWAPAFLPLDPPMPVQIGERMTLALDRPSRGEWTWRVDGGAGGQRHSTLFASPMTPETLRLASRQFAPSLTIEGRAALDVLARCDGTTSVERLAAWLGERYPDRYSDSGEAIAFVQRVIRRVSR
jgi:predicted RNA methylase